MVVGRVIHLLAYRKFRHRKPLLELSKRYDECPHKLVNVLLIIYVGQSRNADSPTASGGLGLITSLNGEALAEVRFGPHYGLEPDIVPGPKSADSVANFFLHRPTQMFRAARAAIE
jgi:hypothetical protein